MGKIKNDSWIITRPVAHRGLHNIDEGIPENSLPAFKMAVKSGYPIELDVHQTIEGDLFILHDFNTKRVCGRDVDTADMHTDMLNEFKLHGTEYSIPLFEDVLNVVDGKVPMLIEIKSESLHVGKLEDRLLKMLENYKGDVAFESFNPLSMRYIRKRDESYMRGQLSYEFKGKNDIPRLIKKMLINCKLDFLSMPDFIAYDIDAMPKDFLRVIHKKNKIALLGWTVRTEFDRQLAEKECDNYIFEKIRPH